jgi:hypothetical protein
MRNKHFRFATHFSHVCLSVLMTKGVIQAGVKCLGISVVLDDFMTFRSSGHGI